MIANVRHLKESDYQDIKSINESEHPDYELESKVKNYPEGCLVADLDGIIGYLISFPYVLGKIHPTTEEYKLIKNPDCYYIYDLSVITDFKEKGIEYQLAEKILESKWPVISLATIREKFWKNFGFLSFMKINYCGTQVEYMIKLQ